MLILTIRTDKPEAELGLFEDQKQLAYLNWQAHRQLSETIHIKIKELLASQNHALKDLSGIVVYQGPGSFTGLRIGLSVANALAYSLEIAVTGGQKEDWIKDGIAGLLAGHDQRRALPEYGAPPHITPPKGS